MNGNFISLLGILVIAFGTFLTYFGQSISARKSQDELKSEIRAKDEEISELVYQTREEKIRKSESIDTIRKRANEIVSHGDFILFSLLKNHGSEKVIDIFNQDYPNANDSMYADPAVLDPLYDFFRSITLLDKSSTRIGNNNISEFDTFLLEMKRIYDASDSILQHYGEINDPIIQIIDDIRSRSKLFLELLPLLKHLEGGVPKVLGNGVPDQYADFFRYYFLCHLKLKQICRNGISISQKG